MASKHFSNVKTKNNTLTFDVKDVDLAVLNSLRRIILVEIPTVALDFDVSTDENNDIKIKTNTSCLHNEFLGHRLSLIPLCFNNNEIKNFNKDKYIFELKVKNTTASTILVTTKDIKIYDESRNLYPESFHRRIFPANRITGDHILIIKLRPNIYNNDKGEEIDIEFKGSVGIGKQHARWSAVSCCTLHNQIDDDLCKETLNKKLNNVTVKEEIDKITSHFNTLEKYRCYKKNKYDEPSAFHFKITSECALTPLYILETAVDILIQKVFSYINKITIKTIHEHQHMHEIIFTEEDYTLLNLLQSLIYNFEIRENKGEQILDFIGYYQPHPLDQKILLKVKFNKNLKKEAIIDFFNNNNQKIIDYLRNVIADFKKYK